jgi:hypothetical protein
MNQKQKLAASEILKTCSEDNDMPLEEVLQRLFDAAISHRGVLTKGLLDGLISLVVTTWEAQELAGLIRLHLTMKYIALVMSVNVDLQVAMEHLMANDAVDPYYLHIAVASLTPCCQRDAYLDELAKQIRYGKPLDWNSVELLLNHHLMKVKESGVDISSVYGSICELFVECKKMHPNDEIIIEAFKSRLRKLTYWSTKVDTLVVMLRVLDGSV